MTRVKNIKKEVYKLFCENDYEFHKKYPIFFVFNLLNWLNLIDTKIGVINGIIKYAMIITKENENLAIISHSFITRSDNYTNISSRLIDAGVFRALKLDLKDSILRYKTLAIEVKENSELHTLMSLLKFEKNSYLTKSFQTKSNCIILTYN